MKKIVLLLIMLPLFAKAQTEIFVEGASGNLYINHTLAAKENFYSIGRLYNISPKDIAPYNKLNMENGLSIGQNIKIPMQAINFIQVNKVAADEVTVPLYHRVEAKETLYQLSTQYNKVAVSSLKAWNNLKDDALTPGQNVVVGYLKVKKDVSAYAQNGNTMPIEKSEVTKLKDAPVYNVEIVKETPKPKKEEVVNKILKPASEIIKPEVEKNKTETIVKTTNTSPSSSLKTGVFKAFFLDSGKEESGEAGVFKSTSGWEDGKYYCLQNSASQGTIVKITNPATGKFVYAKVLDVMPDLKQNDNLAIRISNSAADALGASSVNFQCKINY